MCSSGFIPVIKSVTRPYAATGLNHIWIARFHTVSRISCGVIDTTDLSDHYPVYVSVETGHSLVPQPEYRRRILSKTNYDRFSTLLRDERWTAMFVKHDPDGVLRAFKKTIYGHYYQFFPVKTRPPPPKPKRDLW